jgi:hypothetical protein
VVVAVAGACGWYSGLVQRNRNVPRQLRTGPFHHESSKGGNKIDAINDNDDRGNQYSLATIATVATAACLVTNMDRDVELDREGLDLRNRLVVVIIITARTNTDRLKSGLYHRMMWS